MFLIDIQEKNIMLGIYDISILADLEQAEKSSPSPRKIVGDRVIYSSRKLPETKLHGQSILCDFGQARFGSTRYCGDIQPYKYRAPEVLLRMSWDQKVDIWNVGVVVSRHIWHALNPIQFLANNITTSDLGPFPKRASLLRSRFNEAKLGCQPYR